MPLFEVELEDGKTYEIDSEREPTHDEVYAALGFKRDTGESRLESFAQKIPQTIVSDVGGFVKAPGAVASIIPGMEDNASLRAGDAIKNFAKETFPENPLYENEPQQDVASAIGQGIGMILPAGVASKLGMGEKALEIMGLTEAGALGATGGQETADQYGVTNPLGRANLILGGAAREAGTEMIGGFGSKEFSKALAGDIMTILKGQALKKAAKTVGEEGLEEVVSGLIEPIQTRLATSGLSGLSTDTTTAENGQPLPALPWTMQGVKDVAWQGLMGGVGGAVFALPQYVQLKSTPKLNQAIPLYLATKQHIDELKAEGKEIPQELDDNFTMLDSYVQANGAKAAVNYAATLKEFTDANTPEERKAELGQILSGYESGILEVAPDEVDDFRAKILSNPDLDQDIRDAASVAQYVTADDDPTGAVLEGLQSSIEQLRENPVVQAASPTSPSRQDAKVAAQKASEAAAATAPMVAAASEVGPETAAAVAEMTSPTTPPAPAPKTAGVSTPTRSANRAPFYIPPSGAGLAKIKAEAFRALRRLYGKKARGVTEGTGPGQVTFTTSAEYAESLPEGDPLRNEIENSTAEAFVHGKKGNIIVFTDRVHVYNSPNYDEVALARKAGVLPQSYALARLLAHEGTHPLTGAMQRQRASLAKMTPEEQKAWRDANPGIAKLVDEYDKLLEDFSRDWRQIRHAARREPKVGASIMRGLDENFASERRRLEADVRNAKTATDRLEAQRRMNERLSIMEAMAKNEIEERFGELSSDQVDWLFDEFLSVMSEQDLKALESAYGKDKGIIGRVWSWLKRVFNTAIGVDPDAEVDLGRMGNFLRDAQDVLIGGDEGNEPRFSTPAPAENEISKVSSENDKSRVGTAKLGTAVKPQDTPQTSNISGEIIPRPLLEAQMAKVNYKQLPKEIRSDRSYVRKRRALIDWMKDNLKALHDAFPAEYRARATHWYDGANRLAVAFGEKYGTTMDQAAGVMAVLSPQKDWFMNVAQAWQVMDLWKNHQTTPLSEKLVRREIDDISQTATPPKAQLMAKVPGETPEQEQARREFNKNLKVEAVKDRRQILEPLIGKTIAKLDKSPYDQGWAIRVLAQAVFGRNYHILAPEGDFMELQRNNPRKGESEGALSKNGWGSINEIEKAVRILKDGSLANISNNLGDEHKVRNFFNNIAAPNSPAGDVTIDTHAVAAAHLMPFGASALEVLHNFGSKIPGSGKDGISGIYHIYIDAYRELAKELGIQPRQLQSITWEAVRQLFPAAEKDKEAVVEAAKQWQIGTTDEARARIIGRGIPAPAWSGARRGGEPQGEPASTGADSGKEKPSGSVRDRNRGTASTLAGGLGGGVLEDRFSTPSTDEQKDPFTKAPTEFHGRAVSPDQASRAYERLAALGSPDGKTRSEIAAAHGEIPEQARILSEWLESKGYEPIDVHRTFDAVPVRYGDDIVTNLKGGKFNELGKGAEGSVLEPTSDPSVVYKVFVPWEGEDTGFGIKPHMRLKDGKLLVWNYAGDIFNPIEKSRFIAGIGGVPQEFHGVDPDGYLVMKMPKGTPAPDEYDSTDQRLMQEFPDPTARPQLGSPEFKAILKEERTAINSKMEATIKDHGLRRVGKEEGIVTPRSMQGNDQNTPYLAVLDGVPYLVTDVRFENVLQDNQNQIRISDAAVSQLEPQFYEHLPKLKKLVKEMIANEPEGRAEARFSTPLAQASSSATVEDDQGAKAGEDKGDGRANLRPGRRDGAGAPVDWRGKRIQLTHWSFNPSLKSSDPGKHGTGGIGAEKSRKRDYPKLYVDRTYFGYGKYRREQFIGGERYTTEVDGSKIYDLDRDPLDLYPDSKELRAAGFAPFDQQAAITMFENRMKEAGFSGYRSKNSNAVALFDKAKLTKVNNSDKSEPPIADRFSTPESTNKENENADTGTTQEGGPQDRSEAGGLQDGGRLAGGSGVLEKPGGPLAAGEPLRGLTGKAANIDIPGRGVVKFGPFETARDVARKYMEDVGLPYHPPTTYQKVDPKRAARIADEYEKMAHDPSNPEVAAAYKAMIDETIAQWNAIMKTGLKVEPMVPGEDPYAATPRMAVLDVIENNHMWFFPTSSGFGSGDKISDNPLEATKTGVVINGMELVANDMFRVVHDYFGHIKEGVGFRADGEENAWRSHSAMYSPLARKAMTTETRGQNSWLNFGPYGEKNRTAQTAETVFAPQKIGLLPEWVVNEASGDVEHEIKFSEARFSTPSDPIAAAFRTNMVMKPLLDSTGSGPFDGGCLVVAKALQKVLGGSIIRMQSWRGDEHYGVRMPDGSVYDGDGKIASEKLWIKRIEQNEGVQEQMWIEEGLPVDEKPSPVDDPKAVDAVADALEKYLKQYHGIDDENAKQMYRFSTPVTDEQDSAYMKSVESGDMDAAQKMVNEAAKKAGYTIGPVYHGTASDFTEFDVNAEPNARGFGFEGRKGSFFTELESEAEGHAYVAMRRGGDPKVHSFFLKIENPYSRKTGGKKAVPFFDQNWESIQGKLEKAGADGLVIQDTHPRGHKIYAIYSPYQAKSADPVTRDENGDVIPLSERFNEDSNDTRFSTPLPSSAGRYDRTSWTDNDVAEWMKDASEAKYNELVEFAQTMGTRTQTKYLREGVGVMTDFVRRELAGLVEDGENEVKLDPVTGQVMELPPIDDAHVSQYIKLARKILTNKTFARRFKERFQKYHADTVEAHVNRRKVTSAIDAETGQMETMTKEWLEHKDYAVHKGSAVVAVLQLELMNIAQRLALTLDTKGKRPGTPEYNHEMRKLELMQMLMPAANDTIIGDYMTIRDAARSLQVRSMAVQGKGFWRAIKLIDRARQEAAMETGKKEGMTAKQISDLIQSLSSELNLNVIPEIVKGNLVYDKVEELLQAAMDNQAAQIKATEEEEQDWWSQAVKTFSDEEQELLDAFKILMEDIANDAKLIGEVPGPGKSSVPDPGSERSHEDIVKGLVEKRARAMALLKKLVTVQTKNAARISKELRKKILNDKRLALLKPDPQGQKLIDQYLNAPKVKVRAKEENPVKDAFIKQVREPVPEEEFVLELQKLGMSKETAYNLASVARDQIEEKRERDAELNAPKIAKAEAKRVAADLQKYYREIEKAEKQEAALIERLAKERQKEQAKQDKKAQADLEKEIRETQKEKEKAQREAERLSNIPTDIAQSIIDQIDEEKTEWLPPDAKRAPEVQRLKRAALVDARTAPGVIGGLTRERFIEQYSKAFRDAGVKDAAAHTLATRLYEENIKLASNRVMSKRARMEKSRKFLEALIKNIYSTSISAKSSGTYAEEQAVEAFRAVGMTEATAKQAAAGLSLAVRQAQQKAQMEALERAAAKLKLNNPTIETLKGAIRSGLFNPADPVASALAKLSGFKELSLEDYKRLAEADDMTRGTSSEAAKGQSIMLSIMRKSDPPKKIRDMIYSAWVPDAISGLSNYMLNLTSPAFAALRINGLRVVEIMSDAARGKTDFGQTAARLARLVTSFNRSMREMVDQMRFAAVHDAYKNRMAEHVRNMDALLGQGEKAIEIFRSGMKNHDPVKVLEGSVRWVYSTVNLIRRSFSTIDQAWASGLARQTFEYEAYRELFSNAKIRPAEAAAMMAEADTQAENGLNAKQLAREKAGATPMDTATQNAVKHDLFREALLTQMRDRFGVESADQMAVGADKDADMELGNRDSETAPNWDVFNNIIEMVKKAAIAMRRVDSKDKKSGPFVTALSHMITGFLSVPGNVLNRSFYFTPVGILRAASKLREFKNDELTSHYNETMATRRQAETRMLEGIIGTILMVAYMALKLAGKKDDEDKNEWGFDINGAGPKDPKLREAWLKKGHRQNAMELRTPWGFASIPWGRGGFEGISMMMLPMAAVKDMQLNGIDPAKGENIGRYAGAMANAFASQAKFFGAKDSASGLTSTDQQVVGGLTYSASPFLPFSGLLKSITKALGEDSPMERSSPTTAFWSSVPVAGVAGTARINAFGDQMGDLDWMNRAWFAGVPLAFSSGHSVSNDDLYSYILRTGIAPAIPNRSNLERSNGAVTDEVWMKYAETRGQILKKEMKKELHKLMFEDRKDAENAVEKLSADATKEAKKKLGLK